MNTWFTSDLHFYHKRIIDYCPKTRGRFKFVGGSYDLYRMNEALVEMWNSFVKSEDTVYFLGDWSLHPKNRNEFLTRLNGNIVWIKGNHDHKSKTAFDLIGERLTYYCDCCTRIFNDKEYFFVHSPFDIQKYNDFLKQNKKIRIVCGHIHEKWKLKAKGSFIESYIASDHAENGFVTQYPIVNVGCDAWNFKMVSLEELEMTFKRIE